MLTVNFLEALGRRLVFLGTEIIERAVIQDLDRLLDILVVLVAAEPAAAREAQSQRRHGRRESPDLQRFRHIPSVNRAAGLYHVGPKKRGAVGPLKMRGKSGVLRPFG